MINKAIQNKSITKITSEQNVYVICQDGQACIRRGHGFATIAIYIILDWKKMASESANSIGPMRKVMK